MVQSVVELDKIRRAVQRRENARRWETLGQIALGVALTFIMPMLVAAGMAFWGRRRFGMGGGFFMEWGVGTVALWIVMAIAYGMEWWYRGSYLMQRMRDIGTGDPWRDTWNDRYWQYEQRAAAAWMEMFMFVPRQVFEGLTTWRASRLVAGVQRESAVMILGEMKSVNHAVLVDTLRAGHKGSSGALEFDRLMAYLVFYQWVAVSEDGERAWLGKISRDELAGNITAEN